MIYNSRNFHFLLTKSISKELFYLRNVKNFYILEFLMEEKNKILKFFYKRALMNFFEKAIKIYFHSNDFNLLAEENQDKFFEKFNSLGLRKRKETYSDYEIVLYYKPKQYSISFYTHKTMNKPSLSFHAKNRPLEIHTNFYSPQTLELFLFILELLKKR